MVKPLTEKEWNISLTAQKIAEACRTHDLECIDPTPQLRAEAARLEAKGEMLYFPVDGHWNAQGHRFMGELLARYVIKSDANRDGPSPAVRNGAIAPSRNETH